MEIDPYADKKKQNIDGVERSEKNLVLSLKRMRNKMEYLKSKETQ
jgi:hypothetical protein